MTARDAISNLEKISQVLEKVANRPENYNTQWAYYLEQMSFEMYRHANELRDLESILGMTFNENVV